MAQVPETSYESLAPGGVSNFSIPFDFLYRADVFVEVDGVSTAFTWINAGMISIVPAPVAGAVVLRYRSTPAETTLHVFEGGVPFTPKYIDENNNQLLYVVQESVNAATTATEIAEAASADVAGAIATSNTALVNSVAAQAAADAANVTADAAEATADAAAALAQDAMDLATTAGVASFNGRQGVVVPFPGDYTVSDITGAASIADVATKAPLASPALTGTPTAPTAPANTNSTQIATTAYVDAKPAGAINNLFWENAQEVSADYTITSGKNAMTAGPVTINSGVTVTVPIGSTWSIV